MSHDRTRTITANTIARALVRSRAGRGVLAAADVVIPGWFQCDVAGIDKDGLWSELEVKVTRADFGRDASKERVLMGTPDSSGVVVPYLLRKHDALEKGTVVTPNRFSFVAPLGLLDVSLIPRWAGLVELEWRGGLRERVTKVAPLLHASPAGDGVRGAVQGALLRWVARQGVDVGVAEPLCERTGT